jgi:cytochrome c oxidase cbb3-type subunit 3
MRKINKPFILLTVLALIICQVADAQPASSAAAATFSSVFSFYTILGILGIVLLFQSSVIYLLVRYIAELNEKPVEKSEASVAEKTVLIASAEVPREEGFSKRIWKSLTRPVPKGKEKDVMLDHNYDGIRELDNRMPPWLQLIFYSTVLSAAAYLLIFQVFHIGMLPKEEYAAELKQAAIQKQAMLKEAAASVDEQSVVQLTDAPALNIGKSLFLSKCSACHGMSGEGNVGPNLTDGYWLHGGSVNDIFKTVKYGVPAKGMISWQSTLQPQEMQDVVSYIMSLQGTNPANPKIPQGDLYTPRLTMATDSTIADTLSATSKI